MEAADTDGLEVLRNVFDSMATEGKITMDQLPFVLVGAEVQASLLFVVLKHLEGFTNLHGFTCSELVSPHEFMHRICVYGLKKILHTPPLRCRRVQTSQL